MERVFINGEQKELTTSSTITELIASLNLPATAYAVAVNATVVPKARHGEVVVKDGDKIEIIEIVGGG